MKFYLTLCMIITVQLLTACTPHPGAGVWQATEVNDYGISRLIVSFDGRAEFVTSNPDTTSWHCFWAASGRQEATLNCSASTNSEQKERYILTISEQNLAELRHKAQLVARFTRLDENPVTGK